MTGQSTQGWNDVVPGVVGDGDVGLLKDSTAPLNTQTTWGASDGTSVANVDQMENEAMSPPTSSRVDIIPRTTTTSSKTHRSWVDEHIARSYTPDVGFEDWRRWRILVHRIVQSTAFNVITTSMICVNSVIMGFETEYGNDSIGWVLLEGFFLAFYSLELLFRLGATGFRLEGHDKWIYFDSVIVVVSFVDVCLIEPLSGEADARTMALVLRTLRLMKLARIIRLLRFFRELWLLVSSFISAFKTLTWTFSLLLMVIYVFGIIFVRLLGKETDNDALKELFGTLPGAMFTLFQIATLEGWPDIARLVWTTPQWYMGIAILGFMMVTTFSIMNTVLAVIVEHTLTEAIDQRADMMKKNQAQLHHIVHLLGDIYKKSDSDHNGVLTKEEFIEGLMNPKTRKLLHGMELGEDFSCLDPEELGILFDTIDVDDSCELTPAEFVKGLVQMRGAAKARGVFELRCDVTKHMRKLQGYLREVRDQVQAQHAEIVALDRQRLADFKSLADRLDAIDAKLDDARLR